MTYSTYLITLFFLSLDHSAEILSMSTPSKELFEFFLFTDI